VACLGNPTRSARPIIQAFTEEQLLYPAVGAFGEVEMTSRFAGR
jgi:hypothetical protein